MPTSTARTADDITESIRTLVDRLADAKLTQELAKRGHDVAEEVGSFAEEAWRESKPMRRDARKQIEHTIADASKAVGSHLAQDAAARAEGPVEAANRGDERRRRRGSGSWSRDR